jgi:hypothetical protein
LRRKGKEYQKRKPFKVCAAFIPFSLEENSLFSSQIRFAQKTRDIATAEQGEAEKRLAYKKKNNRWRKSSKKAELLFFLKNLTRGKIKRRSLWLKVYVYKRRRAIFEKSHPPPPSKNRTGEYQRTTPWGGVRWLAVWWVVRRLPGLLSLQGSTTLLFSGLLRVCGRDRIRMVAVSSSPPRESTEIRRDIIWIVIEKFF